MTKAIKLDKDLGGNGIYASSMGMDKPFKAPEESYPEFSFEFDEPCDLPEEGTLMIKYRLVRHATDTTNEDRPRYSYTVCVKKLISAEGERDKSPTKSYDSASGALDALVKEKESESELEEY